MSKARDLANAGTALTTVSATELGYLDGVTSAVQTQIDSKIGSASAINPTIVDAKGDIIAASAADTPARLAIGSNDTVLMADSSTATGLKWSAPSSGGMTLLSTTTLSGATTTISGISGSYNSLYAVIYGFTNATATGQFRLAPNGSTGITNTAYHNVGSSVSFAAAAVNYLFLSASGVAGPTFTSATNSLALRIDNYADTNSRKPFNVYGGYTDSGTGLRTFLSWGHIDTLSAITSLVFSNSGGNHNAGTVLLYGVK